MVSALVAQQPAAPKTEEKKEETLKLEKFEVTGSRIKRVDAEGPQPVLTITAADIQARGYETLGDFVQTLSFNSGGTNSIVATASFTRGAATANPRGLGSNRFLVLINGRRSATYPLTDSNNNSVFNFNSIPTAAIDSIEYLKDGASAIYGSDAVTGVMNIKLKKNFSGFSTDYSVSQTTGGHDHLQQRFNLTAGGRSEKTSVMVTLSGSMGNSTFIKDYARSRTTDYTQYSSDPNRASNLNSSLNWPANLTLTTAQAVAIYGPGSLSGTYVLSGGQPTSNPTKAMFGRVTALTNANRYDFAQTYQLFPEYNYQSMFANFRHEINEKVYAFGSVLYSNNWTNYYFTPSVIASTSNPGTGPSGLLNLPATNPYNPFGVDITNFSYRTSFGPPRIFETEDHTFSVLAGLGGTINQDWTWEVGANFANSHVASVSRNAMRATDLQAALNGTTRATALNPFGVSDNQDVVNKLFTVSNSSSKVEQETYDGIVSGKLLELQGRPIGLAVGTELRNEKLRADPDTASYVGSGGGTPFKGKRNVKSAFTEVTVPVFKQLELQGAVRYEKYSDFGDTTKPKIGASLRVLDWLKLRGSYSESFKAPDLGRLYTTQTTAFSSTVLTDPKRPQDPAVQMKIVSGGNPNLQPEEAKIKYAGVVIDVPRVKNLELTVDWFQFDINNVISAPGSTTLLAREDLFPGAVVRDNTQGNPGPILYLRTVPFNIAKQFYEGFDYSISYRLNDTKYGSFRFGVTATQVRSSKSNSGIPQSDGTPAADFENLGLYYTPEWKANGTVSWSLKDWSAAVSADYNGAFYNDAYTTAGWHEGSVTAFNGSVNYRFSHGYRVTIGANNMFNKQPPFNGKETVGYMQAVYGYLSAGRSVYIRIGKDF
jgi:outer membrane receptor protein involved in Fe transport